MLPIPDRPRLRPLEVIKAPTAGDSFEGVERYYLRDPSGESEQILFLSEGALWIVSRLDGNRDVAALQEEACRVTGEIVPRRTIEKLVAQLEEASFLDSPSFRERARRDHEEFRRSSRRPAVFAGRSYEADPSVLGAWIDSIVIEAAGTAAETRRVRGLVAPHIDPIRGARVYGRAYGAIRESPARRIVILGISHAGGSVPFAPLAKDIETPFGDCPLDHAAIAALCRNLPYDTLEGEILHRREHSIEFQAIFLRRILQDWSGRRVVPILCCSPWLPEGSGQILGYPDSWGEAFVRNLSSLIDGDTLVVAGIDFAHVGRRFGDDPGGIAGMRSRIEEQDRRMVERIAAGDLAGFEASIAADRDARRVCGYPAVKALLRILPNVSGSLIDYEQAVDESIDSLVSFGAIALF